LCLKFFKKCAPNRCYTKPFNRTRVIFNLNDLKSTPNRNISPLSQN
jgi:hypothetical protein